MTPCSGASLPGRGVTVAFPGVERRRETRRVRRWWMLRRRSDVEEIEGKILAIEIWRRNPLAGWAWLLSSAATYWPTPI